MFKDGAFDLVLAVDSFPYLHLSGIAEPMLGETARVLAPGGDLVVLNYSYRGDPEADRRDIARFAEGTGLSVLRSGSCDFTLWDGAVFHLRQCPRPVSRSLTRARCRPSPSRPGQ
jgi:hypothetical protein